MNSEIALQDILERTIQHMENLFPILLLLMFIPLTFSSLRIVLGLVESAPSSDVVQKEKIDLKKVKIISKYSLGVKFSFYVRYMEKQGFLKGLFVQFLDEYIKIGKHVYKLDAKKYIFSTNESVYIQIKETIQQPIASIQDDAMLLQFNEAIHYALSNLSEFCKMKDIVNLEQEVERVSELVQEIKRFSDEITNAAKLETEKLRVGSMNEILEKHHLVMEQLTLGVKIFNGDSSKKINLKK